MHGQLYCGHTNAMALFSSPVVSALGSESGKFDVRRSLKPCKDLDGLFDPAVFNSFDQTLSNVL